MWLIVHPEYRSQGIGKEMIRLLVDKIKEANLHLELFTEKNNMPYYEKLGFEEFAIGMKYKATTNQT